MSLRHRLCRAINACSHHPGSHRPGIVPIIPAFPTCPGAQQGGENRKAAISPHNPDFPTQPRNDSGWKRPRSSSGPTVNPTLPRPPRSPVPKQGSAPTPPAASRGLSPKFQRVSGPIKELPNAPGPKRFAQDRDAANVTQTRQRSADLWDKSQSLRPSLHKHLLPLIAIHVRSTRRWILGENPTFLKNWALPALSPAGLGNS